MGTDDAPDGVSVDVDIDDRTVVRVSGTRDAALVVVSESGEEIYLPPEEFADRPAASSHDSPYEGGSSYDSPYEGSRPHDSPYDPVESGRSGRSDAEGRAVDSTTLGVEPTPDGFRVLHPEPVTDFRLLR